MDGKYREGGAELGSAAPTPVNSLRLLKSKLSRSRASLGSTNAGEARSSDLSTSGSLTTMADVAVALIASTGKDSRSAAACPSDSNIIKVVREEDLPVPTLRKTAADAFKAQFSDAKSSTERKTATIIPTEDDDDIMTATLSTNRRRIGGLETPIVPREVSGYDELLDEVEEKKLKAAISATAAASAPGLPYGIKWTCSDCSDKACIPVRSESRCLCGHRLKEHKAEMNSDGDVSFRCCAARCHCKHFFYLVAEGAWILRCRCKHKHIDHDPSAEPFKCKKPACSCHGFDSPWVCNCGHPWVRHRQSVYKLNGKAGDDDLPDVVQMSSSIADELSLNYRKDGF